MKGGIERGTGGDRGRVEEEERGGRQGVGVKKEGRRAEGGLERGGYPLSTYPYLIN